MLSSVANLVKRCSIENTGHSVTRLGYFWKFFMTNFRSHVTQIFGHFYGFMKNVTFELKTAVTTFGQNWATFYCNIWSHWFCFRSFANWSHWSGFESRVRKWVGTPTASVENLSRVASGPNLSQKFCQIITQKILPPPVWSPRLASPRPIENDLYIWRK